MVLAFTLRSDHSWPVAIGHLPFLCVVSIQVQVSAAWSVVCMVHVRPDSDLAHVECWGFSLAKQTVGAFWPPGVYADGEFVDLYKAICVIRCQWTAPGSGRGLTKLLEVTHSEVRESGGKLASRKLSLRVHPKSGDHLTHRPTHRLL